MADDHQILIAAPADQKSQVSAQLEIQVILCSFMRFNKFHNCFGIHHLYMHIERDRLDLITVKYDDPVAVRQVHDPRKPAFMYIFIIDQIDTH